MTTTAAKQTFSRSQVQIVPNDLQLCAAKLLTGFTYRRNQVSSSFGMALMKHSHSHAQTQTGAAHTCRRRWRESAVSLELTFNLLAGWLTKANGATTSSSSLSPGRRQICARNNIACCLCSSLQCNAPLLAPTTTTLHASLHDKGEKVAYAAPPP